jgi:DNA-binding response OmpR family regulator
MIHNKWKVLVVDDEPNNLQLLEEILQDQYQLSFATDGAKALDVAWKVTPDLILLDIMMPEMDGYETCRRLKADSRTAKIPVIFVTAMGEVEDERRGFEVGGVDYLTKPVSPPIVLARVKTHLALKHARDDLEQQNEILRENVRLREDVERITRHDLKTPLNAIIGFPQVIIMNESLT